MRKPLFCPYCKTRIIDANIKTKAEVRVATDMEIDNADFYTKCKQCKQQIAITKV